MSSFLKPLKCWRSDVLAWEQCSPVTVMFEWGCEAAVTSMLGRHEGWWSNDETLKERTSAWWAESAQDDDIIIVTIISSPLDPPSRLWIARKGGEMRTGGRAAGEHSSPLAFLGLSQHSSKPLKKVSEAAAHVKAPAPSLFFVSPPAWMRWRQLWTRAWREILENGDDWNWRFCFPLLFSSSQPVVSTRIYSSTKWADCIQDVLSRQHCAFFMSCCSEFSRVFVPVY